MNRTRITAPPWHKKLLFWAIIVAVPLGTLELGLRTYFAFQLGSSMLFYGTRLNRQKSGDAHSGDMHLHDNYFKYHPYEERFTRDHESGRLIRATINGSGFRGRDFDKRKAPHVIRIVTLGASSTFGFSDRDDETYPYYLEQLLNRQRPGDDRFEVINFGIPHLKSGQILSLFKAEALPLHPDVVTFYEGVNDSWSGPVLWRKERAGKSVVREKLSRVSPLRRVFRWLRDHLITVIVADRFMRRPSTLRFTETDLEEHMRGRSENFLKNIGTIDLECRRRHITFIVASQQAKSFLVDRKHIRGVTYGEESILVRQDLDRNKHITNRELYFLTHNVLMRDLEAWAAARGVPYADVIGAMDQRRDCLVSWVHLNPEGNRMVARAFATAIRRELKIASAPDSMPRTGSKTY
ncbi:MAG: SGNH/GDSL hydrolase family protein [Candidatus Krumholzibacteriia bacterium]